MSERNRREDLIANSLGIPSNNDSEDFDMSEDDSSDEMAEDIDQAEAVKRRREIVAEQKEKLALHDKEKPTYEDDEEFARSVLRELVGKCTTYISIQEEEMQLDPSPRNAETAATLITAATNALDKLQTIGVTKERLALDKRKLGVKAEMNGIAAQTGALIAGTFSELLRQIKTEDGNEIGTVNNPIEVEAIVVEDDKEETDAD